MDIKKYKLLNTREKSIYRKQVFMETGMLYCGSCGKIKDTIGFRSKNGGYQNKHSNCSVCAKEKDIKYNEEHLKEKLEYDKTYYQKTKSERKVNGKIYRSKPEVKEMRRIRSNKRYKTDEQFKQGMILRLAVSRAFRRYLKVGTHKNNRVEKLIGCTLEDFVKHISSNFKSGMTLFNYGEVWNFDHKIPCNNYDLSIEVQQKKCFNYTNYQPLTLLENAQKGALA